MTEWQKHKCPEYATVQQGAYHLYGAAIGDTLYFDADSGLWMADDGEYADAVRFCPYCGVDLRTLEGARENLAEVKVGGEE